MFLREVNPGTYVVFILPSMGPRFEHFFRAFTQSCQISEEVSKINEAKESTPYSFHVPDSSPLKTHPDPYPPPIPTPSPVKPPPHRGRQAHGGSRTHRSISYGTGSPLASNQSSDSTRNISGYTQDANDLASPPDFGNPEPARRQSPPLPRNAPPIQATMDNLWGGTREISEGLSVCPECEHKLRRGQIW
jgi:hypothetical protein